MPQDKTSTLPDTESKTIADLAKEFDFDHPIVSVNEEDRETEWLDENGDVETQQDIEDDQQTVADIKSEKTVRTWKESSTTRIFIVVGALSVVALGLVSLFSLQMPKLNSSAVTKVGTNEEPESELMFAEDGDYAAQSAYAEQNAAFGELNKTLEGRPASAGKKQPKTPPTPARPRATPPQRSSPPRIAVPQRTYTPPPPTPRVTAPPKRSVIPIPRTITRPTAPAPAPAKARPRPAVAPPRSAPTPPPVVNKPRLNPMEQWLIASGAGVTAYDVDAFTGDPSQFSQGADAASQPFNSYEESLFGITLPIGSTLKAQLDSPVVFSPDIESNQTVLIAVEATDTMPSSQLVATYAPASGSNSRKTVVQLTAKYFVVDGETVPVNPKSILITGHKGKGLLAKQSRSGGGILSTMGKILLGGGQTALSELNRPDSQIISTGPQGTTQSTNFGDSDVLAGAGFGMAEQALQEIESRNPSEPSLDGVWQMDSNQKLELHIMEDVFL